MHRGAAAALMPRSERAGRKRPALWHPGRFHPDSLASMMQAAIVAVVVVFLVVWLEANGRRWWWALEEWLRRCRCE